MNIKEKRKCSVFIGLVLSFFLFLFPNNFNGIEKEDEKFIPAVSVIVPVYKTEKYLKECADSISGQTLKNIEIIYVDDGSPDNCPQILDKIAENDKRVKVIHQKNQGSSTARQAGLDIAIGEYIKFVDSDDILDLKACEICYNKAKESGADVLYHSTYCFSDINNKKFFQKFNDNIINKQRFTLISGCVWSALYKREFLKNNNINYYDLKSMREDVYFNMVCIPKAKIIQTISDGLYYYRLNNTSSLMHVSGFEKTYRDRMHNYKKIRENWEKFGHLKSEKARIEFLKFLLTWEKISTNPEINKLYVDTIGSKLINDQNIINKLPVKFKNRLNKIMEIHKTGKSKKEKNNVGKTIYKIIEI